MNKERSGRYIKCKIVQPGPDLSRPDVGALRPSPEEVWRHREPELVQKSGFKNLPRRRVSFLIGRPTKMDGGGGSSESIYNFWLAWDSHPHSKIWLTKTP